MTLETSQLPAMRITRTILRGAIKDIATALSFALVLLPQGAAAAEDVWQTRESSPVWQSECGSCHMAFPPALLARSNWQQMMQGLDRHFGVNASLEPRVREEIDAFLQRNSGTSWSREADSLRITETGYFKKRHRGGIAMLNNGRIKSLADCVACHQ